MGGSSSKQSTEQRSTQFGDAIGVSGTNIQATGDVIQQVPQELVSLFGEITDLASSSIEGAGLIVNKSLEKVAERATVIDNPSIASQTALTPLILGVGALGVAGILLMKVYK